MALLPGERCIASSGWHKRRWPNRESAELVSRLDMRGDGLQRYVYQCKQCDGWHVTKRVQGDAADRGR